MLPKSFCTLPFGNICLNTDGTAKLCNNAANHVAAHGRPLSLHTETLEQIWNSDYMRQVRRDMIAGKAVAACVGCYRTEADGGRSMRQLKNSWPRDIFDTDTETDSLAAAQAIVSDHDAIATPPSSLDIWLGNLCNLKCRTCSPIYSSQIAADPIHSQWKVPLTRSEIFLPDDLPGVEYAGFGEIVQRDGVFSREISMDDIATVTLPWNGDPIAVIEITGLKDSLAPIELSLTIGSECVSKQWLEGRSWGVAVTPDPPYSPHEGIRLSLKFAGVRQGVSIATLKITTAASVAKSYPRALVSRIPENPHWASNEKFLHEELLAYPGQLRFIHFAGGEPLINPHLIGILEKLVLDGHATNLDLYFSSNGTVYSRRLTELLRQFKSATIGFSLDGVGALYDYIRPPAKWDVVSRNVFSFRNDGVEVIIHPTTQAYNVFGLLELLRFCDANSLSFDLYCIVYAPSYLSLDMLPQQIVDEAIAAFLEYRDTECKDLNNRAEVDTLIAALKRPRPANIGVLQDLFIRFTNDMDVSRGQSLRNANPDLYQRLVAAGFVFTGKHRFVSSSHNPDQRIPKIQ